MVCLALAQPHIMHRLRGCDKGTTADWHGMHAQRAEEPRQNVKRCRFHPRIGPGVVFYMLMTGKNLVTMEAWGSEKRSTFLVEC